MTGFLGLAALLASPERALARPCESPSDRAAVLETTAAIQAQCNCAAAATHRDFIICAERVAKQRKAQNLLPPECINEANRCAKRSTCGRPGWVTCCRTNQRGRTHCYVQSDASKCKAPAHGTAKIGGCPSCCQACGEGQCMAETIRCCLPVNSANSALLDSQPQQCQELTAGACEHANGTNLGPGVCQEGTCTPSTTTTTVTTTTVTTTTVTTTTTTTTSQEPSTTTTTTGPICGNDKVEPGEQCDPPNTSHTPQCPNPNSPSGVFLDCLANCQCGFAGS